jgi:hypothetical protein
VRGLAQLEAVAQDHQPVDVRERREQRRAHLGPAQQVDARGRAEVQVGDDEGAHERVRLASAR